MTGADQTDAVEAQNEVALVLWLEELMAQEFGAYTTEHRARAAGYFAKRLVDSRWLAARDRRVAAEALRSTEDAMGQCLNEFAQGGRHTRARWAQEWLRDRAERVEAGDE